MTAPRRHRKKDSRDMTDFGINKGTDGSLWRNSGFLLRAKCDRMGRIVVEFSCLNPQQEFRQVFSRAAMLRIGLWFLRRAVFGE